MSEPRTRVNLDHVVDLSDLVVLVTPGEGDGTYVVQNALVDRCQARLVDGDVIEVGPAEDEGGDYYAGPEIEADGERILFVASTDEGGWRLVVDGAVEAATALERVEELAAGDRTELVSSPVAGADAEAVEDAPEYDEDEQTDDGTASRE